VLAQAQSYIDSANAHKYPQLCPSYLDLAEFDTDMTDATGLRTVHISA
jgi:hypothetical protein